MHFTDEDIDGVVSAIHGIGCDDVYALAMQLRDGLIQVQILKRQDGYLTPIALRGHPFYTASWEEADQFLEQTFQERPQHIVRVCDLVSFSHNLMLDGL